MENLKKMLESMTGKVENIVISMSDKSGELIDKAAEAVCEQVELAELKNQLVELYIEAGKQVYEKYLKSDRKNYKSFRPLLDGIDQISHEIKEIEESISARKGIRTCEECGKQINRSDSFCPNCGAEQPVDVDYEDEDEEPDDVCRCSNCGAEIDSTHKFCHHCGKSI